MDHIISIADFELLFKKHNKFLRLVSYQIVNDNDTAKDIVQDFFLTVWQKRGQLMINNSFLSYATRAVKNRSISFIQRKPLHATFDDIAENSLVNYEEEDLEGLIKKENLDLKVSKLVELLPADRKKIFLAHAVDGLTYAAIAEKYNISVNTVKTQLKRAYAFLKTNVSDGSLDSFIITILIVEHLRN